MRVRVISDVNVIVSEPSHIQHGVHVPAIECFVDFWVMSSRLVISLNQVGAWADIAEPEANEGANTDEGIGGALLSEDCSLEQEEGGTSEESGNPGHRPLESDLLPCESQLIISKSFRVVE